MVKVSVLMPIYKTNEKYLREAIESVLSQTFTDFEFLILDDCPDDNRESIVKSYNDNRIKYSKNEQNLGISASRNKLIDMAQGQYLAVMDHDDISLPERFAKEVAYLDENSDVGVVGSQYEQFPVKHISRLPIHNQEIEHHLMCGCVVTHPSSMIRKSVLWKNPYEEQFTPAEDYALWCRLIGRTKFYNFPNVLLKYRLHNTNTHRLQNDKKLAAVKKIHDFVRIKHSDLWAIVRDKDTYVVRVKLFGLIPIARIEQQGNFPPSWLKYIPFAKTKIKLKVQK